MNPAECLALAALPFVLGSCSTTHELTATMIGGRLAFEAVGDWWSRPSCFYRIDVRAEDGAPASPAPGDDAARVASGTYWSDWRDSCENEYPAFYGQALDGDRYLGPGGNEWPRVAPKPLRVNVIYSASTLSPGSSYGSAYFRLDGRGGVEVLDWRQVKSASGGAVSASSP